MKILCTLRSKIKRSLSARSDHSRTAVDRARAALLNGRSEDAVAICQLVLARDPGHIETLLLSAEIAVLQRDAERAIRHYTAIESCRDLPVAYYKRGNLLKDLGRLTQALSDYDQALVLDPAYAKALCNRGSVLEKLDRIPEAQSSYERTIALDPDDAFAHYNLARVLQTLGRPEEALTSYARAILLKPDYAQALCNRGLLLTELRRWYEALASYDQCIDNTPGYYQAHFCRGNLLRDRRELQAALTSYDKALQIQPENADAHSNRGIVLMELQRWDDAVASYDRAISLNPNLAAAYSNRADALMNRGRYQDAIADYDHALSIDPRAPSVLGARLHAKLNLCDWQDLDADLALLASGIAAGFLTSSPWFVLGLLDSPQLQEQAAVTWVREVYRANEALGPMIRRRPRERIRVAYFSADFCDHPMAHLTEELFRMHDRSRFETFGYSFGPDTQDAYRRLLETSFDHFADVRGNSDFEIASLSRSHGIDIAVDLGGHTRSARPGIFALRAAPLQVSYMGYPGTQGATYMDYVIADQILLPPESERNYTEKIIYLPDTYMVNNSRRAIADREFTRSELGLPEMSFVFCCFNSVWKIHPAVFDSWMRILNRVPNSVLWLLTGNEIAANHLRKHCSTSGIDPSRLIFATRMPVPEHLARHRSADLFLDTLPCNAHTTASDALWAGTPLLTCSGETFAARVATSLLQAIGLPELIAPDRERYEHMAVELASNPARLSGIKEKLARNRLVKPLFDTRLFTKNLESAYVAIQERYFAELPPSAVFVTSPEH